MIQHHQVKVYYLKTQTLKQVEVSKVSDKPSYDTSLESFDLEITDFNHHHDPTRSGEIIPSQTSNP